MGMESKRKNLKRHRIAKQVPRNLTTAEQMYQYCIDNGFGRGFNKRWGIKHFKLIEQALQKDEEVLMCFIGLCNSGPMSKYYGYFAYAVTNKRMIIAKQRLIGQVVQFVLLKNLNDVTANFGFAYGDIVFDTLKETFKVQVNVRSARNIHEKIHEILLSMENSRTVKPQIQIRETCSVNELLKYKDLLDSGILTQDEFDQKKKQLLGL